MDENKDQKITGLQWRTKEYETLPEISPAPGEIWMVEKAVKIAGASGNPFLILTTHKARKFCTALVLYDTRNMPIKTYCKTLSLIDEDQDGQFFVEVGRLCNIDYGKCYEKVGAVTDRCLSDIISETGILYEKEMKSITMQQESATTAMTKAISALKLDVAKGEAKNRELLAKIADIKEGAKEIQLRHTQEQETWKNEKKKLEETYAAQMEDLKAGSHTGTAEETAHIEAQLKQAEEALASEKKRLGEAEERYAALAGERSSLEERCRIQLKSIQGENERLKKELEIARRQADMPAQDKGQEDVRQQETAEKLQTQAAQAEREAKTYKLLYETLLKEILKQ